MAAFVVHGGDRTHLLLLLLVKTELRYKAEALSLRLAATHTIPCCYLLLLLFHSLSM
jgi:hypothetical protein